MSKNKSARASVRDITNLTNAQVTQIVDEAFRTLRRMCDENPRTQEWFEAAYTAGFEQERGHRRFGRWFNPHRYRQSIETAARYFVVRDWLEPVRVVNAVDAVSINRCALYMAAARLEMQPLRVELVEFESVKWIDYADHMAQPNESKERKR